MSYEVASQTDWKVEQCGTDAGASRGHVPV